MLQSHHRLFHRIVLAADLILVGGSLAAFHVVPAAIGPDGAVATWGPWFAPAVDGVTPSMLGVQVAVAAVAWFLAATRLGVYQSRRADTLWREVEALIEAWVVTVALTALSGLATDGVLAFAVAPALGWGFVALACGRLMLRVSLRYLRVRGRNFRRVLIVGTGESATSILDNVEANPQYGIRIVGYVGFTGQAQRPPRNLDRLGTIEDLQGVLAKLQIDFVIICPPSQARSWEIEQVFELCDEAGIQCHYAPHFLSLRNLEPAVAWYGDVPTFAFHPMVHPLWKYAIKRGMDLLVATCALLILMPLLVALSIAIKLDDGGPVLFRQMRVGRRGKVFPCLKFRTMCVDAEQRLAVLQSENEQDGPVFKIKDDPRVTRVGRLLRRYSLDELPQFLNVLRGEMSVVGPRPPIPSEVESYDWWQRRRISVRPGLTCIWQVWGRNKVSFNQWMEMDLYYIDHWSLRLDLKIMFQTVGTVLRGTGM